MNKKVKDNPAIYINGIKDEMFLTLKKLSSNSLKYAYWSWLPYCHRPLGKRKSLMQLDSYEYLWVLPHCGLVERSIDESESVLPQVYPDFRNYINYSIERDEELDEKLLTLPFNSKKKIQF